VTARARAGASRRCGCGLCGTAAGTSRESGGLPGGRRATRRGGRPAGEPRGGGGPRPAGPRRKGGGRPSWRAGGRGGRDGNAEERKGDKTARGPSCRARQPGSGPKHRGRASRDVHWPVGRSELGWPRNPRDRPGSVDYKPSSAMGGRGRERACVCSIRLRFIRVRRYGPGGGSGKTIYSWPDDPTRERGEPFRGLGGPDPGGPTRDHT
jgi:hypothetical protein